MNNHGQLVNIILLFMRITNISLHTSTHLRVSFGAFDLSSSLLTSQTVLFQWFKMNYWFQKLFVFVHSQMVNSY